MEARSEGEQHIVYRGTGPYPSPCDLCNEAIAPDESYVITDDGAVRHEVCEFFAREDAEEEDPAPRGGGS
jgi:hypothetical protein